MSPQPVIQQRIRFANFLGRSHVAPLQKFIVQHDAVLEIVPGQERMHLHHQGHGTGCDQTHVIDPHHRTAPAVRRLRIGQGQGVGRRPSQGDIVELPLVNQRRTAANPPVSARKPLLWAIPGLGKSNTMSWRRNQSKSWAEPLAPLALAPMSLCDERFVGRASRPHMARESRGRGVTCGVTCALTADRSRLENARGARL